MARLQDIKQFIDFISGALQSNNTAYNAVT